MYWEGTPVLVFFENLVGDSDASILVENTAVENLGILFSA